MRIHRRNTTKDIDYEICRVCGKEAYGTHNCKKRSLGNIDGADTRAKADDVNPLIMLDLPIGQQLTDGYDLISDDEVFLYEEMRESFLRPTRRVPAIPGLGEYTKRLSCQDMTEDME